jgi:uncharacterized membrane protein HdeD (DUF308 family)
MKAKYPIGTKQVPRPKGYRLIVYFRTLGWILAGAAAIIGLLATVQLLFHPFTGIIETADKDLAIADRTLQGDAIAGVSIGTLVLVAVVATLPLLKKGVKRHQYAVSFWRGILSSAIFLGTDRLYRYVMGLGRLYLSATLALFVAITIVLVEIASRVGRREEEANTRTELLASIVSGLVFGLLLQLAEYGLSNLGKLFH